jgi:transcriptional regulator with XRE-family HTH domain
MPVMSRSERDVGFPAENGGVATGPARVGAALRQAREARRLTLEEVERSTRFTARQLRAVEEGGGPDLPPQPYTRGAVVAYAALLGLDGEAAAREWGRGLAEHEGGRRSIFRVPVRSRSSWRDWAVPLACACGTAAYLAFGPAFRPPSAELPELPLGRRAEPPSEPQPAPEVSGEPPAGVAPAGLGFPVTLRSEGSTWIEVAVDGAEPRRQDLLPGQLLELRARQRLGLALGDAGLVRIAVNGRELGFIGEKGEIRRGIVFEAPPGSASPRDGATPR